MRLLDWLYRLLRWGLGVTFIYAGGTKILDPVTFSAVIDAYGIVPESLLAPLSWAIPALEVAAGIGLVFEIRGSLTILAGLLLLFAAVLTYGIWMGLDVDCGCFAEQGSEPEALDGLRPSLYRDLLMLAAVACMYGWRRYRAIRPKRLAMLVKKTFGRKGSIKDVQV